MSFTQVQNGVSVTGSTSGGVTTLPLVLGGASSPNTLLIAKMATSAAGTPFKCSAVLKGASSAPNTSPGWVWCGTAHAGTAQQAEVWAYPNNPGGITGTTWTNAAGQAARGHMEEFSSTLQWQVMELFPALASGASSASMLAAMNNITAAGDLAVALFGAQYSTGTTESWTTPPGWTQDRATSGSIALHWSSYWSTNAVTGMTSVTGQISNTTNQTGWTAILVVFREASAVKARVGCSISKATYSDQASFGLPFSHLGSMQEFDIFVGRKMAQSVAVVFQQEGLQYHLGTAADIPGEWLDIEGQGGQVAWAMKAIRQPPDSVAAEKARVEQDLVVVKQAGHTGWIATSWNEMQINGTKWFPDSATWFTYYANYQPIYAAHGIPIYVKPSEASPTLCVSWMPPAGTVSGCITDYYYDAFNGPHHSTLESLQDVCDGFINPDGTPAIPPNPPIPLGIGETGRAGGSSNPAWSDVVAWSHNSSGTAEGIRDFFARRLAAGKQNAPVVWFSNNLGGPNWVHPPDTPNIITTELAAWVDNLAPSIPVIVSSGVFTERQTTPVTTGASGAVSFAFTQAGSSGSLPGSLLVGRLDLNDCQPSTTVTPPGPGWVLAADSLSGTANSQARSQIWLYLENPGGLGAPPSQATGARVVRQMIHGRRGRAKIVVRGTSSGGVPTSGTPLVFTCSNSGATVKGRISEFTCPAGLVQALDQTGTAGALAPATSMPVSCTKANTIAGGLGLAMFSAFFSSVPSNTWTIPGGWTNDGQQNNANNVWNGDYLAADSAGITSVTGVISTSTNMTSWAAALCTVYAVADSPIQITVGTLPNGVANSPYRATIQTSGGAAPDSFAVTGGILPPGLTLDTVAGIISGDCGSPGSYTFSITVTDITGQTATAQYTVIVVPGVTVTTPTPPVGNVESAYLFTIASSGGNPPYTYAMFGGNLPSGLTLSSTGVISGTPDTVGISTFQVLVTDSAAQSNMANAGTGDTTVVTFTIIINAQAVILPYDSLSIARTIELLGNRAISAMPQCPGACFMLAPGFDVSAPQPTTDIVAAMLLNGERPYGRRFSNRVMTLPIVIQAPTRDILAAAREMLLETTNNDTWELIWTRQGGQPLVFDCFRAGPPVITYNTKNEKLGVPTAQVSITFSALPFGRSDSLQTLAFPAAVLNGPSVQPPVLIDDFSNINTATQPTWWSQSGIVASGMFSAHWDWSETDHDSGPVYTSPVVGSPGVNISGLTALSFSFGLGTDNYSRWHKGNVTFAFSLTDSGNHIIKFGTTAKCRASNSPENPRWNQVTASIPQGVANFDYTNVVAYSIQAWRLVDKDGSQELDSDVYLNNLFAVPTVSANPPPTSRGIIYDLNAIVGTGPSPLSIQVQQAAVPLQQSQTFTTPGPVSWVTPAGVRSVRVQKWGASGSGAAMTSAGKGGGGSGGEYSENPGYPCTPGQLINGYVGFGGGGSGGFLQRISSAGIASGKIVQAAVNKVTTSGQTLIVTVAYGIGTGKVSQITDSVDNLYVKDYSAPAGTTGNRCIEVWRCASAGAVGLNDSIDVIMTDAQSNGVSMICDEYVSLGSPDVKNFAFSSSSAGGITPSATMQGTDGVAIAAACVYSTNEGMTVGGAFTATGPSSDGGTSQHGLELLCAAKAAPSPGSLPAPFSWGANHTCVAVILGYPVLSAGNINGQETWFGADDSTAAHGGLGAVANSSAGANGQTGSSSDVIAFPGGQGASGVTTGGGGGESAGPTGPGHAGKDPAGGTGTPGAGDGGAGGAAGGNNPGSAGVAPGGAGGGAVSTGGSVAGGSGAAGQITLTWTGFLSPFKTALVHRPGLDAPDLFSPLIPVGNGIDTPDGSIEYPVPSPIPGQNARFAGTYTIVLVNYTWHSPAVSRNILVTVKQYEYAGGPVATVTTLPLAVTPNTYDILNRTTPSGNGFVVLGEVTLPVRDIADDQSAAFYTITVTSSDTADRFLDVIFLDTQGQSIIVDINAAAGYANYYMDAPDPNNDIGHLLGSSFDRSQAVSVLDSAIWSGGPLSVIPGTNPLLVYAVEGQPNLIGTYSPCWFTERLQ